MVRRVDPGDGPSAVRLQMTHGPTAVMEARWRDPDDIKPGASRHAREVRGHRAYDPLRWSRRRHGDASAFSELHIHAADRLRLAWDRAALGGLPGVVWAGAAPGVGLVGYQPSTGLSASAMAVVRAYRAYRRAMAIFTQRERAIIAAVVLENISVSAWTRSLKALGSMATVKVETQRLVGALDKLVSHYDSEIREAMALGMVEA